MTLPLQGVIDKMFLGTLQILIFAARHLTWRSDFGRKSLEMRKPRSVRAKGRARAGCFGTHRHQNNAIIFRSPAHPRGNRCPAGRYTAIEEFESVYNLASRQNRTLRDCYAQEEQLVRSTEARRVRLLHALQPVPACSSRQSLLMKECHGYPKWEISVISDKSACTPSRLAI